MRRRIVSLVAVLAVLGAFYAARTVYVVTNDPSKAFSAAPKRTPTPTLAPQATPTPTLSPEEKAKRLADTDFMANRVNILLIGFDESPERDDEDNKLYRTKKNNFRSDVLMLAAVNFDENTVHLISIPRDTYAEIYNTRGRWKINAAFAKGGAAEGDGFTYARKTVELLFQVPIDYYAGVNMEGLKAVVDALGGVDYDVDVEIHLNGRMLETGMQHLDGQQVLDYCRARKGISTDVGRNDRQQRMLFAIFRKLRDEGRLAMLPEIYQGVKDDIYTNLTVPQIAALTLFAMKLDDAGLKRTTLDGEYVSNVYNASYYVLRNKSLAKLVKEEFGIDIKRSSKYDLAKVKRDKAAALAKKAAEELDAVTSMATIPTDTTGAYDLTALNRAKATKAMLLDAIESDASEREIRRLHDALNRAVAELIRVGQVEGTLPEPFRALR